MINEKTTQNMIRAKVAGEFRGLAPSLTPGNTVSLPDGQVLTYAKHSTQYNGGKKASVAVTCYPITAKALANSDPVKIPEAFKSAYLGCHVPVSVVVTERPKTEPQRRSFGW